MKILTIFGTRPEAIKLAPVIRELQRRSNGHNLQSLVCVTAQHREMLDQVMHLFGIKPDYDLDLMEKNQTHTQVASAILARLESTLNKEKPEWVLVQGDTTTVAVASLELGSPSSERINANRGVHDSCIGIQSNHKTCSWIYV